LQETLVAIIKPFRALRPQPRYAKEVSCVPYDVVSGPEVREFLRENPLSFLRVTRPEAVNAAVGSQGEEDAFEHARETLQKYIADEVFAFEAEPSLYVYRLVSGEHRQIGVVGCCSIDEYEEGLIKRHENTRPDKVADRTAHLLAVGAQTGLILLAFRGTDLIHKLIEQEEESEPIYDFCSDGVQHTIWRVVLTDAWIEAFDAVPALYIADGHHRAESAKQAREVMMKKNAEHTGAEDYNFVLAGIFPAEDLRILPYNRTVKDLNGLSNEEFLRGLSRYFIVTETAKEVPQTHGEICMYLDGKWFDLNFTVDYIRQPDPIERLDVSILQKYVLEPVLGIDDPRTDDRIEFIGGQNSVEKLKAAVDDGRASVAFSLFATTMSDLLEISDLNQIMPPKSTWFEPKLKDGLLVHLI
jgi:uncharacterized protein (DUF1015 family)